MGILLTAAVHAPSIHNTQPWRFEVHGPVIDVLLDEERTLPVADPAGRAARIGIGAAVSTSGSRRRCSATSPVSQRTRIRAPGGGGADLPRRPQSTGAGTQQPVRRARRRRHTYRGPLLDQAVSPKVLQQLDAAARAEGARLHWLGPAEVSELDELLRRTDAEDLHDEDRLHERLRWIGGDRPDDGIQENALGPLPARPAFVRDLSAGFDSPHRSQAVYETQPAIAVLSTPERTPPPG